jgi:hypothetical protein
LEQVELVQQHLQIEEIMEVHLFFQQLHQQVEEVEDLLVA